MPLTPKQIAFDVAVKSHRDFLYRGIADLDEIRRQDSTLSVLVDRLIDVRYLYNEALAVEGQQITGHAPHKPFYLDYVDSPVSNALAFPDADHSFIGVTIPLVADVLNIAMALAADVDVVIGIGLPLTREHQLEAFLFWQLLGFIITHEYTHFVHGHIDGPFGFEEMTTTGLRTGNLMRQAREADADGYAAYFTLAHWLLNDDARFAAADMLAIRDLPLEGQDSITFSCFLVAQAGFTFLREPDILDKHRVYHKNTHPPQTVRLHLMSRFVQKWVTEFRPALREVITQARYQSLMDAVSRVIWTGRFSQHAAGWRAQRDFLDTQDGRDYQTALIAELDAFRATLGQWETGSTASA
jgi:hypothetical protein